MDGWVGGWMEGKAWLRIAYSNQKSQDQPQRFTAALFCRNSMRMTRLWLIQLPKLILDSPELESS